MLVAGDHYGGDCRKVIQHKTNGSNQHVVGEEAVTMMCLAYHKKDDESADRTLVSSIRQATAKLGATTMFDVTDQHG